MHARPDLLNPIDDHALTRIQPIADHPQGPNLVANVNRFNAHGVVTVHSGHLIAALQFGNGLLGNKQGAMECFNGNTHFAVLSGAKNVARIREQSCGLNGAGALVDLAPGKGVLSPVWIDCSVGENQLQRRRGVSRFVLFRKPEIFLLAHRESDLDRVNSRNGGHGVRAPG